MAALTAAALRDGARAAMLAGGGCGFMRFCIEEPDALLVTDALRRCGDDVQRARLLHALEDAGFACREQEGLLLLAPADALLREAGGEQAVEICWDSPLSAAQSLSLRWQRVPPLPFSKAGRRLVLDTLRLTGLPGGDVLDGLCALRAQAAVMLRSGDRSGMHEAGALLGRWAMDQR